ncbi:hypothetical protein BpHYR1_028815 [Brachionus plicatilis]|uniref:Uncharacterized protein n=1 Tax=Brachionus plicatilis TaxID=10195 RepID=A0A3M7PCQ9_BRAPC|nr:hypothetical protein BpHYR1_028815 [Brachionus plicatilis]
MYVQNQQLINSTSKRLIGFAMKINRFQKCLKFNNNAETMKGKRQRSIAFLDKCQKVLVKGWSIERSPILKFYPISLKKHE